MHALKVWIIKDSEGRGEEQPPPSQLHNGCVSAQYALRVFCFPIHSARTRSNVSERVGWIVVPSTRRSPGASGGMAGTQLRQN